MSRRTTDSPVARLRSLTLSRLFCRGTVDAVMDALTVISLTPVAPALRDALKTAVQRAAEVLMTSKMGLTYWECMAYCDDSVGRFDSVLDLTLQHAEAIAHRFGQQLRALDKRLRELCAHPDASVDPNVHDGVQKQSVCIHKLSRWYSEVLDGTCVF